MGYTHPVFCPERALGYFSDDASIIP